MQDPGRKSAKDKVVLYAPGRRESSPETRFVHLEKTYPEMILLLLLHTGCGTSQAPAAGGDYLGGEKGTARGWGTGRVRCRACGVGNSARVIVSFLSVVSMTGHNGQTDAPAPAFLPSPQLSAQWTSVCFDSLSVLNSRRQCADTAPGDQVEGFPSCMPKAVVISLHSDGNGNWSRPTHVRELTAKWGRRTRSTGTRTGVTTGHQQVVETPILPCGAGDRTDSRTGAYNGLCLVLRAPNSNYN